MARERGLIGIKLGCCCMSWCVFFGGGGVWRRWCGWEMDDLGGGGLGVRGLVGEGGGGEGKGGEVGWVGVCFTMSTATISLLLFFFCCEPAFWIGGRD